MTKDEFLNEWWAGMEKDMNKKYPADLREMYTAAPCPCNGSDANCKGWLIEFKKDKKGE